MQMNSTFAQLSAWNTFLNASDMMRRLIEEGDVDDALLETLDAVPEEGMAAAVLARLVDTSSGDAPRLSVEQLRQVSIYVRGRVIICVHTKCQSGATTGRSSADGHTPFDERVLRVRPIRVRQRL